MWILYWVKQSCPEMKHDVKKCLHPPLMHHAGKCELLKCTRWIFVAKFAKSMLTSLMTCVKRFCSNFIKPMKAEPLENIWKLWYIKWLNELVDKCCWFLRQRDGAICSRNTKKILGLGTVLRLPKVLCWKSGLLNLHHPCKISLMFHFHQKFQGENSPIPVLDVTNLYLCGSDMPLREAKGRLGWIQCSCRGSNETVEMDLFRVKTCFKMWAQQKTEHVVHHHWLIESAESVLWN